MATERIWPDVAIPPGEVLAETLEARGMSQADLARRMGRPVQAINEIVQGAKEITAETALQLEKVLGTPAHVWTRLETDYRFIKARLADHEQLKREIPLARKCPYRAMAKWGWVPQVIDGTHRVQALLAFFGVASLRQVRLTCEVAFRKSERMQASPEALAAWLRQGEREAHDVETGPFNEEAVRSFLPEMRGMTLQNPETFEPRLKKALAERGVALVLVPHLPGTGAHGATRWLGDRAVVQMSIRYRWEDVFWFSLFHELAHVLLHPRRKVFVERPHERKDEMEKAADRFASDQLIPSASYESFVKGLPRHQISAAAVVAFARMQGIAPSVVVGRLQHDKHVPHEQLNGLRRRFEWTKQAVGGGSARDV